MEKIEGIVHNIFDDFDTVEDIVKERAVAFSLETDKNEKIIIVYDKNALNMGLIKVGLPLKCLGSYRGVIAAIDSDKNIIEDKMFLCIGIMGIADISEEELIKMGGIRL